MNNKSLPIGFMQGRLSDIVNNRIQSFPFDNWKNEFEIASKNNFNIVEWTIDSIDIFKNPLLNQNQHIEILKLKRKHCIEIPSVTCDFFMENPFFKLNKSDKKKQEKLLINVLENCSKLKIKMAVIPLVDNGSIENNLQEKTLVDFFLYHIDFFKEKNITIVFESNFKPQYLKKFINKFPDKYFGINYDTGNSASLGYNYKKEFKCYFNNIKNIHIKDRLFDGDTVPLGEGDAKLIEILNYLLKHNYNGNLILQTARDQTRHLEMLCIYREYIINIMESW